MFAGCTQQSSWTRWWSTSHRELTWFCSTCLDRRRTEEETKTVSWISPIPSHADVQCNKFLCNWWQGVTTVEMSWKRWEKYVVWTSLMSCSVLQDIRLISVCVIPWLLPSQTWSSWRFYSRVWTGSSWCEAVAVKSSPSTLKTTITTTTTKKLSRPTLHSGCCDRYRSPGILWGRRLCGILRRAGFVWRRDHLWLTDGLKNLRIKKTVCVDSADWCASTLGHRPPAHGRE